MAFSPTKFKTGLASQQGVARPSLFKVQINDLTSALSLSDTESILVKAASLPASNIAPLAVNYAGRAYKWPGFRTYDTWTVTVINDENFSIRNKMMEWMRWISGKMDGDRTVRYGRNGAGRWFEGDATVTQLHSDGGAEDSWAFTMKNLWPTELGEIAVDWSSDAIEEYTIGFAYDYWTKGGSGATGSDENVGMNWPE